ncbi:DUF2306 domain-containing protein [Caulobacter segnis]|uniref:DUF2306 domain-containing protein n=1 Tax=Caulobacter segnis (strain ATCC 21756 / DSM 7131 / JCM 7823 / NBRC 15250 / LMG 17158 / TK0059) TaxID=509190 RepID=D5VP56_CAUST|nr:hypothetical protein [Caulobacter segnis]ADG12279.1 conserved hypothetical protein [Caulobacter segnis ATCC 21756]
MDKLVFFPALAVHIATGFLLVAVGLVPILSRKGSRLHRWSGRLFVTLMSVLLAAAWVMTLLRFNAYFAALSATATITLFSGVRVLSRKRPDLDPRQRAKLLDWIATLAVLAIGAWVLLLITQGRTGGKAAVSAALVYAALTYGGWDLWRFLRPMAWPFSPSLWRYEHVLKMLSAYGAVISAFSGNVLTFLPTPWSQLWPTLLFQPMAVIWIAVLILDRKRQRRLAAA